MRWALFFCAMAVAVICWGNSQSVLLWRDALNREVYHGRLVLEAPNGVAQIETARRIYQICKMRDTADAAEYLQEQATQKKLIPTLVVVLDGPEDDWQELIDLKNNLAREGMKLEVANSLVPIDKVDGLSKEEKRVWKTKTTTTQTNKQESPEVENILVPTKNGYWINVKTKVRHNPNCRYYGKGKNGEPCDADDGRPCKICGG